jgi:hypothetical protein
MLELSFSVYVLLFTFGERYPPSFCFPSFLYPYFLPEANETKGERKSPRRGVSSFGFFLPEEENKRKKLESTPFVAIFFRDKKDTAGKSIIAC